MFGWVLFMQRLEQCKKRSLVDRLRGTRDVHVFLFERLVRLSRLTQKIDKCISIKHADFRRAIIPGVRNLVGMVPEIFQVQSKRSVRLKPDDVAELIEKGWLAVRRQTHHFVFVAVVWETDELRERRIKNAERVRKINAIVDLERAALAEAKRGTGEISKAVDGQARCLIKSGNKKRGCEMGEVMLDVMNSRFQFHAVLLLERGLDGGGAANVLYLLGD